MSQNTNKSNSAYCDYDCENCEHNKTCPESDYRPGNKYDRRLKSNSTQNNSKRR